MLFKNTFSEVEFQKSINGKRFRQISTHLEILKKF